MTIKRVRVPDPKILRDVFTRAAERTAANRERAERNGSRPAPLPEPRYLHVSAAIVPVIGEGGALRYVIQRPGETYRRGGQ